jgi:hypothetical protein
MLKKRRSQRYSVRDSLELSGDHGAVESHYLVLILAESKRQLWNLQVRRVTMRADHFQCGFSA